MFKEYCTGCGLCASVDGAEIQRDDKGFRIIKDEKAHADFCRLMCPAGGKQCDLLETGSIWGRQRGVFLSYSQNDNIRYRASSGGVLTSLALFLIDEKKVDGIIQVKQDDEDPIETEVVCSRTREDVLSCLGSRYSSSMPLSKIMDYIQDKGTYAFIGKPCDVTTLRNYLNAHPEYAKSFPYLLSFFCAGAPSRDANLLLLDKLGCKLDDCVSLRYRGNGWPGYATAVDTNGQEHQIIYRSAWRDTLGRDIRAICRFCLDGIGEVADISCGDAWYLDENKKPKFDEASGRNVVFCRTECGRNLFEEAYKKGYITKENYENYEDELPYYQAYQYDRRAAMGTTFLAMKIMGKKVPLYDKSLIKSYSSKISLKKKWSRFKGTLKRIYQGKI